MVDFKVDDGFWEKNALIRVLRNEISKSAVFSLMLKVECTFFILVVSFLPDDFYKEHTVYSL